MSKQRRGHGVTQGLALALCCGLGAAAALHAQPPAEPMAQGITGRTLVGPAPGTAVPPPAPQNPLDDGDADTLQQGRELFIAMNCYGCHGGHGGGGMGPSLRDAVWLYGDSDAHLFASIAQGRSKGMPAWAVMLPEREIWKLVAYLQVLGTPDEPDAPK